MKRLRLFSLVVVSLVSSVVVAQQDTVPPPYKKFPAFPPVKLLKTDSASYFTKEDLHKKSAVLLMLFNPTCDHCKHETEEILQRINDFKDIQIVMATAMPHDSMTAFVKKYELAKYDNIVVGQDVHYFLPTFYKISHLPFLAFYDRKKQLISVFEGALPVNKVLEELKK